MQTVARLPEKWVGRVETSWGGLRGHVRDQEGCYVMEREVGKGSTSVNGCGGLSLVVEVTEDVMQRLQRAWTELIRIVKG